MKNLTFTPEGLIYNNDLGDHAAETGRYYTGLWLRLYQCGLPINEYPYATVEHLVKALGRITIEPGVIVRAPQAPYNVPFNDKFSPGRDQQHPLEIAASLWTFTAETKWNDALTNWLKDLRKKQSARFLHKYQNWDFPNPSHWAVTSRFLEEKNFTFADSFLVASSVLQIFKSDEDVADDLNHTLLLAQANTFCKNKLSVKATEIYKARNPLKRWLYYYRPEVSTLTGMVDLWRPWLEKTF